MTVFNLDLIYTLNELMLTCVVCLKKCTATNLCQLVIFTVNRCNSADKYNKIVIYPQLLMNESIYRSLYCKLHAHYYQTVDEHACVVTFT